MPSAEEAASSETIESADPYALDLDLRWLIVILVIDIKASL